MCSILTNIIRKDLTNIIREYLSIDKVKVKDNFLCIFQKEYFHLPCNEFLEQCYFLQLKRTFPQKHYNRDNVGRIKFHIVNLSEIFKKDYIFTQNYFMGYYMLYDSFLSTIYFSKSDRYFRSDLKNLRKKN